MKRLAIAVLALLVSMGVARADTIRILMESAPDTQQIKDLLPKFKEATGHDVEIEAISYIDMHSKLVPQLIAPQGAYDVIIVDFYWVAEFTKAGWLMPLDDLISRDGIDLSRYVRKVMDTIGKRAEKLFKAGKTKQQMVEARPTRDFDAQWNCNTPRTPDQYVEIMYYDLARHKLKK